MPRPVGSGEYRPRAPRKNAPSLDTPVIANLPGAAIEHRDAIDPDEYVWESQVPGVGALTVRTSEEDH
jgi:hypothetical protein